MIVAIDVYYRAQDAKAVAVCFDNWDAENIIQVKSCLVDNLHPYIPGEFYKRELPCIISVLDLLNKSDIKVIIVDGYVTLNNDGKPGLGAYLFKELSESIPVIGVAKRSFHLNSNAVEIRRGQSNSPLFITSLGIDLQVAAQKIKTMKGNYRMPNILKMVDQESRVS